MHRHTSKSKLNLYFKLFVNPFASYKKSFKYTWWLQSSWLCTGVCERHAWNRIRKKDVGRKKERERERKREREREWKKYSVQREREREREKVQAPGIFCDLSSSKSCDDQRYSRLRRRLRSCRRNEPIDVARPNAGAARNDVFSLFRFSTFCLSLCLLL